MMACGNSGTAGPFPVQVIAQTIVQGGRRSHPARSSPSFRRERVEPPTVWGVVVTCESEAEQVELLERLTEEGRSVRALM